MKTFQKIIILTIVVLVTASCSRVLWIPLSQTSNQRASAIKHLDALENEAERSSKRKIVTADGNDFNTKAISFAMLFESSDGFNGGVRSWGGAQAFDQEVRERYKIHDKLEWSGYIFENKFVHHMYYLVGDGNHMISYYSSRKYDSDFLFFIAKETWDTYGHISIENLSRSPVNISRAKANNIERSIVENSFNLFNSRFNRAISKHKQYASRYEDRSDERRRERRQQQKASSAAMHKAIMGSLNAVNNPPYSTSSTPKPNNYSSSERTIKQAGRVTPSSTNSTSAPTHYAYVKAYKRSSDGPQSMYVSSVFETTMDDVRENQNKWKKSFIRHVAADSAAVHSFDKRARLISDINRAQTAFDSHLRNLQRELDVSAKFVRVNWRP